MSEKVCAAVFCILVTALWVLTAAFAASIDVWDVRAIAAVCVFVAAGLVSTWAGYEITAYVRWKQKSRHRA